MRKVVSDKALSAKDIGKHSANAKNKGSDWRDNNPNSEKYIRNKPTNYLEIDKKFRDLKKSGEDKVLVSGTLDDDNKKIILKLKDDTSIDTDVSKIYDNIDDKTLNSATLDNDNKKITLKLKDDTSIDTDVKAIYDEIDKKINIPDNANENNIAIFTDTKEVKDSNIVVSNNGSTLSLKDSTVIKDEGVEINQNGSGDRYSYVDFHSDDDNADYSARIIRGQGVDGNLEIKLIGGGNIITDFDNGKIFENGGYVSRLNNTDSSFAGNKNTYLQGIDDLDKLLNTGLYDVNSDDVTNAPFDGWFYLKVLRYSGKNDDKWVYQEAFSFGSGNESGIRYIRNKVDGTWDNWTPITLNKEIPIQYLSNLVSYENDWEDYDTNWRPTIVKKSDGMVYINGLIKNGDNGTKVCDLPAEFKPNDGANYRLFICMVANSNYHRVDVNKYGELYVSSEGKRENSSDWLSLQVVYQATPL